MQTEKTEYLPYIDGLRALAVLGVIIYHLNHKWLPGGFSGVDVFFVISGFVVSAAQKHSSNTSLVRFATKFYARRVRRIVPALLLLLVVTSIVSAIFIPGSWLSATNAQTGLYAYFGLSNFILARTSNDYFSPRTDFNPFTHTWSLGIEEQFYAAFPLLFFLWIESRRRLRHVSTLAFAALLIASLAVAWWLASRDQTTAYYIIAARFWELAVGVVLYQAMILQPAFFAGISSRVREVALSLSLFLIIFGFALAHPDTFPYPWAFAPVLGTAGLLALLPGGGGACAGSQASWRTNSCVSWTHFIFAIPLALARNSLIKMDLWNGIDTELLYCRIVDHGNSDCFFQVFRVSYPILNDAPSLTKCRGNRRRIRGNCTILGDQL